MSPFYDLKRGKTHAAALQAFPEKSNVPRLTPGRFSPTLKPGQTPLTLRLPEKKLEVISEETMPQTESMKRENALGTAAERIQRNSWMKKHGHLALLGVIGLCVIAILNLVWISQNGSTWKGNVTLATKSGFEALLSGGVSFTRTNLNEATNFFEEAKREFDAASNELWFLQKKTFGSAASFVEAGKLLADAGVIFTETTEKLQILPKLFLERHTTPPTDPASLPSLTELLKAHIPNFQQASKKLQEASEKFQEVHLTFIPREFRDTFVSAREKLNSLAERVEKAEKNIPSILTLLGDREPHQYLIVLQNRNESRPSGGFIGSYVLGTMNDGYLTNFTAHDVYTSDYQLRENIPPPEEFSSLVSRWFLRDSNYHPHFPVSAERMAWFLQKENGPSVDSVIAIDQTVVEDLLRITGPIFFKPLDREITAENFSFIFSYLTEAKVSGRDDPKKLFKDFVEQFQREIFAKADFTNIALVISKAISEKHLLAYSREPDGQAFFEHIPSLGGGSAPGAGKTDYLQVVNYNIGGNKSDAFIKQKIIHESFFLSDNTVENVVTISKTHTWNREAEKKQRNILASFGFTDENALDDKLRWILGQGNNFAAMRIYVPRGSEILEVSGTKGTFEVTAKYDPEFPDRMLAPADFPLTSPDVNYFATKMDVKAGETVTLKIRYRLPWKYDWKPTGTYSLVFQKQPGVSDLEWKKRIFPRPGLSLLRTFPEMQSSEDDGMMAYEKTLRGDFQLASLWK